MRNREFLWRFDGDKNCPGCGRGWGDCICRKQEPAYCSKCGGTSSECICSPTPSEVLENRAEPVRELESLRAEVEFLRKALDESTDFGGFRLSEGVQGSFLCAPRLGVQKNIYSSTYPNYSRYLREKAGEQ